MSLINYELKFNAEAAPYLDEFTLGFLFASHEDLNLYEEFEERESTNEDLSYLSVVLMRKDCLEAQSKIEPLLMNAQSYGLTINQIGYDYWQVRNGHHPAYLHHLPTELKEEVINVFQIYGKPCSLIQNREGYFIFSYKDPALQKVKEQELLTIYNSLANKKTQEEIPMFSYKNKNSLN